MPQTIEQAPSDVATLFKQHGALSATARGQWIEVTLPEDQSRQLRGRIDLWDVARVLSISTPELAHASGDFTVEDFQVSVTSA